MIWRLLKSGKKIYIVAASLLNNGPALGGRTWGSVSKLFNKDVWTQSVLLSTSIILPEARKLFLDDINRALTNLETLSLDTIIKIPPNSSRDGYLFFPKGPILYNVDEFTIDAPSFIVNIDNEEVSVDGLLVHDSVAITSGYETKTSLAGSARASNKQSDGQEREKLGSLLRR